MESETQQGLFVNYTKSSSTCGGELKEDWDTYENYASWEGLLLEKDQL